MSTIQITPFLPLPTDRERRQAEFRDLLVSAHVWRMRVVEMTFAGVIVFALGFYAATQI
jgi:hypothetical protein